MDAAADRAVFLKGCTTVLRIAKVLRLRQDMDVPRRQANWSRRKLLARDGYQCIYCGIRVGELQNGTILTKRNMTIDHILPRSRGGQITWANTACAYGLCNQRKGARTPSEAGMKLLWAPRSPRMDYWVADGETPESWRIYVQIPDPLADCH